jgi:hypothetical protein
MHWVWFGFAAEGKSEASKRVPVEKAGERTSKDKEENSRKPKTNNDEGGPTELLEKDHGKKSVDISVKQTSTGGGAGWQCCSCGFALFN